MSEATNNFTAALLAHPGADLRSAFDACKEAGVHSYNRTTLNRWLTGSIPTDEQAVRCLAQRLDDQSLLESWQQLQREHRAKGRPTPTTVARRFSLLDEAQQEEAFQEIRRIYLGRYPLVRRNLEFQIEILDPLPDGVGDHLLVSLNISWIGPIQENATVIAASKHQDYGDAFSDPSCAFREYIDIEPNRLAAILAACEPPRLTTRPTESDNPQLTTYSPTWDGLKASFENEAVSDSRVQITVQYPIPRWSQVLPIRFGRYRVEGGASIELRLTSKLVERPQSTPFMPPGAERAFVVINSSDNLIKVEMGTGPRMVLSQGDGVALGWGYVQNGPFSSPGLRT